MKSNTPSKPSWNRIPGTSSRVVCNLYPFLMTTRPLTTTRSPADCLECNSEDLRVHLTSAEEQQAYLAQLDDDDVKALVHLGLNGVHTADEQDLVEILNRLEMERGRQTPVPDDVVDAVFVRPDAAVAIEDSLLLAGTTDNMDSDRNSTAQTDVQLTRPSSIRMLVLVASCVAAFLVVSCVAIGLYITEVLRNRVLASRTAWELLPRLEKRGSDVGGGSRSPASVSGGLRTVLIEGLGIQVVEKMDANMPASSEKLEESTVESEKDPSSLSDSGFSNDDDADEKFHDAESGSTYGTPLISINSLPSSPSVSPSSPAPALPPSPRRTTSTLQIPPTHRARPRAFAAVAELDAALAMQLRPGVGVGADAAWLVRFVMAFFGWCAVLVSGGRT